MQKVILISVITFLFSTKVQSQSIHFEPLSWRNALAKAKRENKMLFVEMFTTWCTYCRQMEMNTFPDEKVVSFYNQHFINVRYDALKTDGIQIRNNYRLLGFPTFLYLNADGLVIMKTAGFQNKEIFISNADSAVLLLQRSEIQK